MKDMKNPSLSDHAYTQIKGRVFDFQWLPGERFSENELARELGISRTPVREALLRLASEGYIEVSPRSGWSVKTLDFVQLEELYDIRTILELAAVRRLCKMESVPALKQLQSVWLVPHRDRQADWKQVAQLDESFHEVLVEAAGNREMANMHREVTERIRIIRRLDFTKSERINSTYDEHAKILRAILQRKSDHAQLLLRSHIKASSAEVRKITLHMLHTAREQMSAK